MVKKLIVILIIFLLFMSIVTYYSSSNKFKREDIQFIVNQSLDLPKKNG